MSTVNPTALPPTSIPNPPSTPSSQVSPLDDDAPIHALLSVMSNPALKDMDAEQLQAVVVKLRQLQASPTKLAGMLTREAKPRTTSEKALKAKAALDLL